MTYIDLVSKLKQKYGEEKYEWLVACHMWHVIARRLTNRKFFHFDINIYVPNWKRNLARRYKVEWQNNCWLCGRFKSCSFCPLNTCSKGSAYADALCGNPEAARYIEEVIYAVRSKM